MAITTVDCPYCEARVLSKDGVCPGCNENLNDQAAVDRQLLKRKASAIAKAARAQGASLGEIETQLLKDGIDAELVKEIMLDVEVKTPQAAAKENNSQMRQGLLWLLGGVSVTAVSYAISREKGGMYIIAWGPAVAGAIQFIRAVLKSL